MEYLNQSGHTSQTLLMQVIFTVEPIAKGIYCSVHKLPWQSAMAWQQDSTAEVCHLPKGDSKPCSYTTEMKLTLLQL